QSGPLETTSYHAGLRPDSSIVCLHFSRSGVLWVGTSQGLYRFEHSVFSPVIPNLNIAAIEESANGNLLLTTSQGFMEWDGSRSVPHPELTNDLGVKPDEIYQVLEDSRGVTWICTSLGIARRVGNSIEKLQPWGAKHRALRVYEDPQNNVWIAGL